MLSGRGARPHKETKMRALLRRASWRLVVLASGTAFFLQGCDADTRAAVESGIITSSSSFLGAMLRAFIELAEEAREANEATASTFMDMAQQFFA